MGAGCRVIDYRTALSAARQRFVATGRLPMDALARDLWVSRATLYRVAGNRDRLLGDVLWQLAFRTFEIAACEAEASGLAGVDRLLHLSRRFRGRVSDFAPVQRFLHEEPADAVRILLTSAGGVHERMVRTWAALLRQAVHAGELDGLPYGVDETAYVLVRIGESTLYGDLLSGIVPDDRLGDHLRRAILCGR
jgi:hypothetical protein